MTNERIHVICRLANKCKWPQQLQVSSTYANFNRNSPLFEANQAIQNAFDSIRFEQFVWSNCSDIHFWIYSLSAHRTLNRWVIKGKYPCLFTRLLLVHRVCNYTTAHWLNWFNLQHVKCRIFITKESVCSLRLSNMNLNSIHKFNFIRKSVQLLHIVHIKLSIFIRIAFSVFFVFEIKSRKKRSQSVLNNIITIDFRFSLLPIQNARCVCVNVLWAVWCPSIFLTIDIESWCFFHCFFFISIHSMNNVKHLKLH